MMRRYITSIGAAMLVLFSMSSCESVFPDDELDYFWKLDRIDYATGYNLLGYECEADTLHGVFFGFSAHMLLIEDAAYGTHVHAMTSYNGDSLQLDFTRNITVGGRNPIEFQKALRHCGVDSVVSTYKVTFPNSKRMILQDSKVKLSFRKW